MTTRHPHYDTIVAWAEGKAIQRYDENAKKWEDSYNPMWHGSSKYRIKPDSIEKAFEIYSKEAYPNFKLPWSESGKVPIQQGLEAVINAVKSGELS